MVDKEYILQIKAVLRWYIFRRAAAISIRTKMLLDCYLYNNINGCYSRYIAGKQLNIPNFSKLRF